jgi:VanZ family protein
MSIRTHSWHWLLALTAAAILILALVPKPPEALSTGWDKSNHVLAFAVLAVLADRANQVHSAQRRHWRWALLLAYGVLIEGLQGLTPTRTASAADVLADALGLVLGATAVGLWRWLWTQRGPARP